jgi:hypothetical protein
MRMGVFRLFHRLFEGGKLGSAALTLTEKK